MVLEGGEPELGNTLDICASLLVLVNLGDLGALFLFVVLILVVRVRGLTSLDVSVGRFGRTGNDGLSSLVQRGVLGQELTET